MQRAWYALLVSAGLSACLAACSGPEQTNVEYGIANQVLFIANGDEPKSLDPHLTTGSPDNNIIMNLFEGLTSKDPKTLEPKPGVAKSWTLSDDGRVYTFDLRQDARWSNGDAVTAEDFVFSWRRALTPTVPNEYAYMMFFIEGAEDYYTGKTDDFADVAIKALSPHKLEVTLVHPTSFFLQLLDHHSYYPVHESTIKKHGEIDDASSRWSLPENFVGNGPFVLKNWEVNKVIELAKSDTYWDSDAVKLQGAQLFPIDDQQAEVRAFRAGQVHLTNTPQMAIEKIQLFREEQPEALRVFPTYSSYYYEFNVNREAFSDPRVRRAFAMAIDRNLIVKNVTKGGEKVSYNLVPTDPEGYGPEQYFEYDVEAAQQLLADAGYPNGEGFPKFTLLYNTHDNHRKVAIAVQQMLKQNLNIDIELQNKEWKVYLAAKNNLEHDIVRAGWIADYVDPTNFFGILQSFSGNNNTGWVSAEYDNIMAEIEATSDLEARHQLFDRLSKILAEEMPVLPIYYYSDINLVHPSVQGWHDNVMHFHPLKEVYLEETNGE